MGSNGNRQGFVHNEPVPIVGQAFTLLEVVPVTVITCNCEGKKTISIPGLNVHAQCPSCRRVYAVTVVQCSFDQATGRKAHNVNMVMAIPHAEPDAGPKPSLVP